MLEDIQNIDIAGIPIFRRDENFLASELFGIPLYWIGIAGAIIWLAKKL